jgi:tRNA nucleotidyltransferase (CCA-adding enzyme)
VSVPLPRELELPQSIRDIAATLETAGYETWCVGGALRDRVLGYPADDVDLATAATPDQVMRLFPRAVAVGVKYGTVGVLDRSRVLHEVTTFRKDVATDGRHAVVEFGVSLEEDLARRDFTMNALAYHPVRLEWRDPFRGAEDLERRLIRAVGEPARRFAEDYLRVLRALRFAARFDFAIDPATWDAAVAAAPGLAGLSAERVREEWFKGLETARSIPRLVELWKTAGAATIWLPELGSGSGLADREPDPRDPVVLTAALCRSPDRVLTRLRGSGEEISRARALGSGPREPEGSDPTVVRRWMSAVGSAVADLLLLARYRLGAAPDWEATVQGIQSRGEAVSRSQLAISGDDLVEAGLPKGPSMGKLLARLLDLVLEDPSQNNRDALLGKAREWS